MSKKAEKKKPTKAQSNWDSFKTEWNNHSIPDGRLDVLYSYKDTIEALSDVEIYFYTKEYDDLIVVEIDEENKKIDISKRGSIGIPQAVKNNLITLIGHLPSGLNLLATYENKVEILSSNTDSYDTSWEKGFSYYPFGAIFTSEYKPKYVLLRLVKYLDSNSSEEIFVLVEKERAVIGKIIQEIKGTLIFNKTNLLIDGIRGFVDLNCVVNGRNKTLKNLAVDELFSAIRDEKIKGRMQKAIAESRRAEIYGLLLDKFNAEKLLDIVTNPLSMNKKDKEKEEISTLMVIKEEYKLGNTRAKKESLSKIIELGKIPKGFGMIEIDVKETFYPRVMSKIESIFFTSERLLVNIPSEKGISEENIADIFEIDEEYISVFHAREEV